MTAKGENIHATAISIDENGIAILGPSGSGKSDLALRLIDRGASLICDDRVIVETRGGLPILKQAPNIAGRIEVRGIGVVDMAACDTANLRLVVQLGKQTERFPAAMPLSDLCGFSVPIISINAFEASAPLKVEIALRSIVEQAIMPVALKPD